MLATAPPRTQVFGLWFDNGKAGLKRLIGAAPRYCTGCICQASTAQFAWLLLHSSHGYYCKVRIRQVNTGQFAVLDSSHPTCSEISHGRCWHVLVPIQRCVRRYQAAAGGLNTNMMIWFNFLEGIKMKYAAQPPHYQQQPPIHRHCMSHFLPVHTRQLVCLASTNSVQKPSRPHP